MHYINTQNIQNAAVNSNSLQTLKESELNALKTLALLLLRELEHLENFEHNATEQSDNGKIHLYDEMQRYEASLIRSALIRCGGVQRRAAAMLGLKVTTLNVKIKRYKIDLTSEMLNGDGNNGNGVSS
jgi:transcriptional regulator with GAF, ATPase, and Fis domain